MTWENRTFKNYRTKPKKRKKIKYFPRLAAIILSLSLVIQVFYPLVPFLPSFGKKEVVSANDDILATGEKEKVLFQNVNPEFKVEFGNKETIDKPFVRFESISSGDHPFAKEENEKIKPGLLERLVSSLVEEKKQGVELTLLSAGTELNERQSVENGESKMENRNTNEETEGLNTKVDINENGNENGNENANSKIKSSVPAKSNFEKPAQGLNVLLTTEKEQGAGGKEQEEAIDVSDSEEKSIENLEAEAELKAEEKILEQMEKEMDNLLNEVDWKISSNEDLAQKKETLKKQILDDLVREEEAKAQTVVSKVELKTESQPGENKKDVIKNVDFVPGVDAEYSIKEGEGVKEEIIIKNNEGFSNDCLAKKIQDPSVRCSFPKNMYSFSLKLDPDVKMKHAIGVMNEKNPQGVTFFEDSKGKYLFHFENLFAVDAKDVRTDAVKFAITEKENQTYDLKVIVDPAWLFSSERAFPVRIDPSIVHNTKVQFDAGSALNRVETTSDPKIQSKSLESSADVNTVGLWHMNETSGTTVNDSSGRGNNGTATGTTIVDGKLGKARSFNGSSDYINIANEVVTVSTNYTVEAWINLNSVSGVNYIFSEIDSSYNIGDFCFRTSGSNVQLAKYRLNSNVANNVDVFSSNQTVTTGKWYHVAATNDNGIMKVYINGVPDSASPTLSSYGTSSSYVNRIGFGDGSYFNGIIDEVKISNIALTPEQIKADYSKSAWAHYTSSVLDLSADIQSIDSLQWSESGVSTGDGETPYSSTGLVGHWKFNETSGTTAADSSGNGNNGTLTNFSNTTGQDVVVNSGWTANNGKWPRSTPKALMFDGTDDWVDLGSNSILNITNNIFTISAWVKTSSTGTWKWIYQFGEHAAGKDRSLVIDNNNKAEMYIYGTTAISSTAITDGNWHHITGSIDGTSAKIYVDGKLESTVAVSLNPFTYYGARIGQNYSGSLYKFPGTIDNVQVYNRALSADEILANYNATNIEFQTRTGTDATPDDGGWEEWKPSTSESQMLSMDNDEANWDGKADQYTKLLMHADGTNGLTSFSDKSLFTKTITRSGDAQVSTSQSKFGGSSAYFDGSGDYLEVPNSDDFNFGSSNFTIDFWMTLSDLNRAHDGLFARNDFQWIAMEYNHNGNDKKLSLWIDSNGSSSWDLDKQAGGTKTDWVANTWYHIAVVRNGSSIKVYVDGQEDISASFTGAVYNPSGVPVYIGRSQLSDRFHQGYIDEFRISKGIARWTSNFTPPATPYKNPSWISEDNLKVDNDGNTKLLLHGEGTNGSNSFIDSSFSGKTVTSMGNARLVSGKAINTYDNAKISTTQSKFGGSSAYFDGSGDYLSTLDSSDFNVGSGDFSVDGWFYVPDTSHRTIFASNSDFVLGAFIDSGKMRYFASSNGTSWDMICGDCGPMNGIGSTTITTNTWHHFAFVRNGNQWLGFIDGNIDLNVTVSGTVITKNEAKNLGRWGNAGYWMSGYLDEFRFSKGIARWTSGFSVPTSAYSTDSYTKLLVHGDGSNNATVFTDSSEAGPGNKFGSSGMYFDGNGDYLNIPDNDDWNFGTGEFAIDFWFYAPEQTANYPTIISTQGGWSSGSFAIRYDNTGQDHKVSVFWNPYGDPVMTSTNTFATNTWHHVAVTRSGTSLKLYVDGVNEANYTCSASDPIDLAYGGFTNIGWGAWDGANGYFNGYIDEVRISKGVARWTSGFSVPTSAYTDPYDQKIEGSGSMKVSTGQMQPDASTVGLWHLDETGGSGAYIKDSSGNGNHGTPTGTTLTQGRIGKARSFNGTSDYVNIGNNSSLQLQTFSLETWLKRSQTGILDMIGGFGLNGWIWNITAANKLSLSKTGVNECLSTGTIADLNWHYVSVTYDGATCRFYIDGQLDSSPGYSQTFSFSTNFAIGIRQDNLSYPFHGSIDEFRVSNVIRTAEEIAENYRMGRDHRISRTISSTDLSGKTKLPFWVAGDRPGTYLEATVGESAFANGEPDANTVGLWHLDEQSGSGAYIKDSSNFGNHGTTNGAVSTQGKIGKARSFNSNSIALGALNISSQGSPFSVFMWINTTQNGVASDDSIMFSRRYGANTFCFDLEGSYLRLSNWGGGAFVGSKTVNDGKWHHVGFTWNGTTAFLYVDGSLDSSSSISLSTQSIANGNSLGAFDSGTSRPYIGQIDEVNVSNIARSAEEIRQAYEVGLRTHPVTVEFNAKLDGGNLIANSGDTSFTIDTTASGSYSNKGENLYQGDKIIIKENYDGTEYLAQGTVTSVSTTTGAVTVASWDSGSTFPASGFTANATVFKWQREWMDLTSPLTSQIDSTTRLTLRSTDGNEGRNIFLDDFKAGGPYLTTPNATGNVTSTKNRYMQYRALFSTRDGAVTPALTGATVNYSAGPSSTDVLMRHGKWFDSSGTLKPHWWGR